MGSCKLLYGLNIFLELQTILILSPVGFLLSVIVFVVVFGIFLMDVSVWSVECWIRIEIVSLGIGLFVVSRGSLDSFGIVGLKYLLIQIVMGALVLGGIVTGYQWLLLVGLTFKIGVVPGFS